MNNHQSAHPDAVNEDVRYRRLVTMALGDKKLVARLIHYEAGRSPNTSRVELIQNAIDSWVRDHNMWR